MNKHASTGGESKDFCIRLHCPKVHTWTRLTVETIVSNWHRILQIVGFVVRQTSIRSWSLVEIKESALTARLERIFSDRSFYPCLVSNQRQFELAWDVGMLEIVWNCMKCHEISRNILAAWNHRMNHLVTVVSLSCSLSSKLQKHQWKNFRNNGNRKLKTNPSTWMLTEFRKPTTWKYTSSTSA